MNELLWPFKHPSEESHQVIGGFLVEYLGDIGKQTRVRITPEDLFEMFMSTGRIVPGAANSPRSWWAEQKFNEYVIFFETRGVNYDDTPGPKFEFNRRMVLNHIEEYL